MKAESWVKRGLKVAAVLGVLAAGGRAATNPGTPRVIDALAMGKRVDCASGVAPADPNYPYDAIGVFGGGLDDDGGPSLAGRMRLDGAAKAYEQKLAPRIVLVGDADGEGSGRSLGKKYLLSRYSIPKEAILVAADGSINTATDAARLAEMARSFGWKKGLLSESSSHGDRSAQFVCHYGLAVSWFAAHVDGPDGRERLELAATSFDPDGWLPTIGKRITLRR